MVRGERWSGRCGQDIGNTWLDFKLRVFPCFDRRLTGVHTFGVTGVHAEHLNTARAACAAAVRFSTISLAKTLFRCFATVRTLEARMMAISALLLPWLTQSSTSASRLVKPSFCKGTASRT